MTRLDDIKSAFFEAAVVPDQWQAALSLLAARFSALCATAATWRPDEKSVTWREVTKPLFGTTSLYADYYCGIDPHIELLTNQPVGRWIANTQFFDDSYIRHSEFYMAYLRPLGLRYSAFSRFAY